jgi:hypothetical protein
VTDVRGAQSLGDEDLDGLPEDLAARIAEYALRLGIDVQQPAVVIHDEDRIWRELEQRVRDRRRCGARRGHRGNVLSNSQVIQAAQCRAPDDQGVLPNRARPGLEAGGCARHRVRAAWRPMSGPTNRWTSFERGTPYRSRGGHVGDDLRGTWTTESAGHDSLDVAATTR